MKREDTYSLLLLAGGKSSRMGRDKAELLFEGKTFLQQLLYKAAQAGIRKKYLSGHGYENRDTEVRAIEDRYKERGPLGGLHAGLLASGTPFCLVLPVDVPQLPEELLCSLLEAHEQLSAEEKRKPLLVKHGERTEPLIGIYPADMAGFIENEIREQAAPVFRVLDKWGYDYFETKRPSWLLENINTPQAYEELLRQEKGRRPMREGVFLEEAIELIKERASRITQTERRGIAEAGGYCLAEDIFAGLDNPPFSRSPVDGYALRAQDLKGASKEHPARLRVTGCVYAGDNGEAVEVNEGEAVRIMTGAPFPRGCDTAVRQEDTDYGEETVEIYREQQPFDNYCRCGEDYKKGSLLVAKHTRLTFAEQGILAGNGCEKISVFRKPAIRVFTTGDELVPAGNPLLPGKIYDSNGMMVSSRIRELGITPKSVTHLSDSAEGVAEALKKASRDADIIVTTGGVSVGKKDILHEALALLGAEKIFWRVWIQPGTPTIFSVYENTLILSLSGNPFGAMANVELLLRPMLEALTGDSAYAMKKQEGMFKSEFPKASHGRRFVRALYRDGGVYLPEGIFSSGAIGTLRGCNCLLDIPAGNEGLKKGERVTVWML